MKCLRNRRLKRFKSSLVHYPGPQEAKSRAIQFIKEKKLYLSDLEDYPHFQEAVRRLTK